MKIKEGTLKVRKSVKMSRVQGRKQKEKEKEEARRKGRVGRRQAEAERQSECPPLRAGNQIYEFLLKMRLPHESCTSAVKYDSHINL